MLRNEEPRNNRSQGTTQSGNDSPESLPTLASVFNLSITELLTEIRNIEEVVS